MAATTVAFYGIRLEVTEGDLDALEARSHLAILAAKNVGLEYYWGNFDAPGERWYLFVGKSFGKLGMEDRMELQITADEFNQTAGRVSERLLQAQLLARPSLYLQFQPDA